MSGNLLARGTLAPVRPDEPFDTRARYLRALYREHKPDAEFTQQGKLIVDQEQQTKQWAIVRAEYERLFQHGRSGELAQILSSAWTEERRLRGERYDYGQQAWVSRESRRRGND